ncbi:AAA family ATPase [Rhodopirellula bahusiensis]|uniref:AAA family ATPase n=1 Tax=Rhodopirellula bahusiensis TaxID=2014065 RepID=UPI003299014D
MHSHEHEDAISELALLCGAEDWRLSTWDIDRGMSPSVPDAEDPLGAIHAFQNNEQEGTHVLVLRNFHRLLQSAEIVQAVHHAVVAGKTTRNLLVILSPVVDLPAELATLFVTVEHSRPNRRQLNEIARGVAVDEDERPADDQMAPILDAASGLTRLEAENAFSLSLVRHQRLEPEAIWEIKTQTLESSGLLTLHRGGNGFDSLGGLASLKAFTRRALLRSESDRSVRARGVMLLSPPGCGKSEFCKCLGTEVGRPVLTLDVGSLLGSLVGQSEERTRQALRTIDAMAPCVLMIDEVEKAFSGARGSANDSGVSSRMMGTFLTWLNDHESDVFVVCTANDVKRLPPEFSRAERFDGVFFLDLPGRTQKDEIWRLYRNQFGIATDESTPEDDQWTGAEIKSCCRLAALLDVSLIEASKNVVPVAKTSSESIGRLRQWANGRCLSSDHSGLFQIGTNRSGQTRRAQSAPSMN